MTTCFWSMHGNEKQKHLAICEAIYHAKTPINPEDNTRDRDVQVHLNHAGHSDLVFLCHNL